MSDLLVLGLKLLFLALLWLFVLFAVNVIRTDLFGRKVPESAVLDAAAPTIAVPVAAPAAKPKGRRGRRGKLPTTLRIVEGPLAGASAPLAEAILIGRSPDATLDLGDEFMSTRHALISLTPSGYAIQDLGSTNGTSVNGRLITAPTTIGPQDAVRIGRTTFTLGS